MKLLFTQDDVTFEGRQVRVEGASLHPRPVQAPHPPVWIGGKGPKRLLPMVGRHADAWHGRAKDADTLRSMTEIIDRSAEAAGRDPASILRASSLSISDSWDDVRRTYDWLVEGGIGYLVVDWPGEGQGRVEEFIAEVMPILG